MLFFVSVFLIASFEILKLGAETLLCQLGSKEKNMFQPHTGLSVSELV